MLYGYFRVNFWSIDFFVPREPFLGSHSYTKDCRRRNSVDIGRVVSATADARFLKNQDSST